MTDSYKVKSSPTIIWKINSETQKQSSNQILCWEFIEKENLNLTLPSTWNIGDKLSSRKVGILAITSHCKIWIQISKSNRMCSNISSNTIIAAKYIIWTLVWKIPPFYVNSKFVVSVKYKYKRRNILKFSQGNLRRESIGIIKSWSMP